MKKTLILFFAITLISFAGFSKQINKEKLDAYFDTLANNNKFMGSVAISQNGTLIYNKSVGFTDIEHGIKASENSKYRIASISKTFTTILVFKAIEENKLSLNQTIDLFFPTIKNAGKITVENLLYWRSGIPDYINSETFKKWNIQPKTEQELIEWMSNAGSDFDPGTKKGYSNSNFSLLTFILEKIYRKPFSEMLEEKIIKPIGLNNTYYGKKINIKDNECNSYEYISDWKIDAETDVSLLLGAAGIVSTPVDLTLFSDALFNGKLISTNSLQQMQTLKDDIGMGLLLIPFHSKICYGFTGGIDGFYSVFAYFPDRNITIACSSNGLNYNFSNIVVTLSSAVYNKPFEIPQFKTYQVIDEDLDKYLGTYLSEQYSLKMAITKNNGKLTGQLAGQMPFMLEAAGEGRFEHAQLGIIIEFNATDKKMALKQSGRIFYFVKKE